jgi:hypothetical protein
VWEHSAEAQRDGLIRVGASLVPPLATIVAHHVAVEGAGPLSIEGDGVTPELGAKRDFAGQKLFSRLELAGQVRSVFVVRLNMIRARALAQVARAGWRCYGTIPPAGRPSGRRPSAPQ